MNSNLKVDTDSLLFKTFINKIENGLRHLIVYKLSSIIPFSLIVEYPKSGGSWLGQLLSSYLNLPFRRNTMPNFTRSINHGHYLPAKNFKNINQIYYLVRDGRDVMVSEYFHCLIWNDKNILNPKDVIYHRKQLAFKDYEDIRNNLPKFIDYKFNHKPNRLVNFLGNTNWALFNQIWLDYYNNNPNVIMTSYEKLLENTEKELYNILSKLLSDNIDMKKLSEIIQNYSFSNQSKRKQGTEDKSKFLRKGISGDWKNYFNKSSAEVFKSYSKNMLFELGYEKNDSWILNLK